MIIETDRSFAKGKTRKASISVLELVFDQDAWMVAVQHHELIRMSQVRVYMQPPAYQLFASLFSSNLQKLSADFWGGSCLKSASKMSVVQKDCRCQLSKCDRNITRRTWLGSPHNVANWWLAWPQKRPISLRIRLDFY